MRPRNPKIQDRSRGETIRRGNHQEGLERNCWHLESSYAEEDGALREDSRLDRRQVLTGSGTRLRAQCTVCVHFVRSANAIPEAIHASRAKPLRLDRKSTR